MTGTGVVSSAWRMQYLSLVYSPVVCESVNGPSYVPVLHSCYELIFKKKVWGE